MHGVRFDVPQGIPNGPSAISPPHRRSRKSAKRVATRARFERATPLKKETGFQLVTSRVSNWTPTRPQLDPTSNAPPRPLLPSRLGDPLGEVLQAASSSRGVLHQIVSLRGREVAVAKKCLHLFQCDARFGKCRRATVAQRIARRDVLNPGIR